MYRASMFPFDDEALLNPSQGPLKIHAIVSEGLGININSPAFSVKFSEMVFLRMKGLSNDRMPILV